MSSPSNIQKGIYSDSATVNPYLDGSLLKEVNHGGETVFPSAKPKWSTPQVYSNPEFYHSARVRESAPVEGAVLEISTDEGLTWSKCPVINMLNSDNFFITSDEKDVSCRYAEDVDHLESESVGLYVRNKSFGRFPILPGDILINVDNGYNWVAKFNSDWDSVNKSDTVNITVDGSTTLTVSNILSIIEQTCESSYNIIFNCETSDNFLEGGIFTDNEYIHRFDSNYIIRIGGMAFEGCINLKIVNTPNCKIIDSNAFYGCSSLRFFYNFANIEKIGAYAFYNCVSLQEFSAFNATIGSASFHGCKLIDEVVVFEYADPNSFEQCIGINHVGVTAYTTQLYSESFKDCTGLEFVDFTNGDNLTQVAGAFIGIDFSKCIFVFKDRAQYELLAPQIGEDINYYINNDS